VKELVGRTIAREILRQQIFYDDLGNDRLTWAFSPSGTYALKVHSGSVWGHKDLNLYLEPP